MRRTVIPLVVCVALVSILAGAANWAIGEVKARAMCDHKERLNLELVAGVQARSVDGIRRLLAAGADVNHHGVRGSTPLHLAAQTGDESVVRELLLQGADPMAADEDGLTPLVAALYCTNAGTADALLDAMPSTSPSDLLGVLVYYGCADPALTRLLASRGADVNGLLPSGDRPLHACVRSGNVAAARALLLAGADPGARDADGRTVRELAHKLGMTHFESLLDGHGRCGTAPP